MLQNKLFEQINEQMNSLLKNSPLHDVENNVKAIILAIFNKLDLVTREEFDTQQRVLLATRQKLDEIEQAIKKFYDKS